MMCHRVHLRQLAKQIDKAHLTQRTSSSTRNPRIRDDHRQALSTRNGNVYAIPIKDEGKATRSILTVAGAKGKNADRRFLALEPIDAPYPSPSGENRLQSPDLGIVRSNEQEIFKRKAFFVLPFEAVYERPTRSL